MKTKFLIFTLLALFVNFYLLAQPGSLDNTFDSDGKVSINIGTSTDGGSSTAIQSDGKIVVAGFSNNGSRGNFALARYNSDGSLDSIFDTDGKVTTSFGSNDYGNSVAIQSDGKIVVAGSSSNGTNTDFAVARYNSDGSLDNTFDTDGKVTTAIGSAGESVNSVAIQNDGKIVAVGSSKNGSTYDFAVVRYNTDGSLDNTFDTDGKVTTSFGSSNDYGKSVAIQSDGKIVVAGYSSTTEWDSEFAVVRYNSDGSLDNTFYSAGKVTTAIGDNDRAHSVAIQSDGKIVVGGSSDLNSYGTSHKFALVRYNTNGTLDNTFDTDGKITTGIGNSDAYGLSVAIKSNGDIVVGGYSYYANTYIFTLARYGGGGGYPSIVKTDIGGPYNIGTSVAIQNDGKIVMAGRRYDDYNDFALTRYKSDLSLDSTFDSDGIVTTSFLNGNDVGNSVAIQSDGKIVVAGYSTNAGASLVRYNSDGSLDSTFDSDGIVTTVSPSVGNSVTIQSDGKMVVAGSSGWDFGLARYNTDGSLDSTFDSDGKVTTTIGSSVSKGNSIAIQSDGKIVVAGYSKNDYNNYDFALVRYNTNGSLDNTFDSDGIVTTNFGPSQDYGRSVAILSNGKIVVAGYSNIGGYDVFALVCYNSNGSLDNTFDSDGMVTTAIGSVADYGYSIAIQSDDKIVVAGYTNNGSNNDIALARYNSDGALDTTFDSDGIVTTAIGSSDDNGYSVVIQGDGKIVVAGDSHNGSNFDFVLVRYNSDGSLDNTFDYDGKATTDIGSYDDGGNSVAIQSDGKILVTGYSSNGSNNDLALVRYNVTCSSINFSQSPKICNGQSIKIGNQTYTISGTYVDTLTATNSCDSIVTTFLTVADTIKITNNASICDGDNFLVGANIYTVSGIYIDSFIAMGGCDSVVTTNLTVNTNPAKPTIAQSGSILTCSSTASSYQWYQNGNVINMATNITYTATQNGTYKVEITDINSCKAISDSVSVIITSVMQQAIGNSPQISIYPNPGNGIFSIVFQNIPTTATWGIEIYNVLGKKLYATKTSTEIDLSKFIEGIYFVKIYDGSKIYDQKIIVQ